VIEKLDSSLFDWQAWRAGSPADLLVGPCRTANLIAAGAILRAHAFGWCEGGSTPCRPKARHKALMFEKDGVSFWFHLRDGEARVIFPEILAGVRR